MNANSIVLLMLILSIGAVYGSNGDGLNLVNAEEIVAQIQNGSPVDYDNAIIEGYIYLKSKNYLNNNTTTNREATIEQGENAGIQVRSPIKITNSIIEGNVNFDHGDFQEIVNFEGTNFTKGVSFRGAIFRKNSIFTETEQCGYVNFWLAKFGGDANFEKVIFKEYADFRHVQFNKSAIFLSDKFRKDAKFYKTIFLGPSYFSAVNFDRDASFGNTIFDGIAEFDYSLFNGYADFRFADFSTDATFRGSFFNGSADFRDSKFKGDSDFLKTNYATDFDIRGIDFSKMNINWPSIANYLIADGPVYLQLIKNFKNLEQFDYANDCYLKYRINSMNEKSPFDAQKYLDALAFLTCGFGVRPGFSVIWMLIFIVLFAILYWAIDIFKEQPYPFAREPPSNIQNTTIVEATKNIFMEETKKAAMNPNLKTRSTTLIDALIFSAALFFTLPPPLEYIKSRRFRILYIFEDILGWLMMALFMVTLLNVMLKSI